jgi:hypothetical protein
MKQKKIKKRNKKVKERERIKLRRKEWYTVKEERDVKCRINRE